MTTVQIGRLFPQRILAVAAVALAIIVPCTQWANATDDNPFGKAVKVADAALDTVRGGFMGSHNVFVPFGIDVRFRSMVNGVTVSHVHMSNHGNSADPVHVSAHNLNVTVTVPPTGPLVVTPTDTIAHTIGPNMTQVTTQLGAKGVMTLIQNTRPNVTLQTQQVLDVQITGMQNLIRTSVATSHFNGRGFFH